MFTKNMRFTMPILFILGWLYLEFLLQSFSGLHEVKWLVYSATLGLAALFVFIASLVRRAWLYVVFFSALTLYYLSQFVYHAIFKTFYTFYSMGRAAQVAEFWPDILRVIVRNSLKLLLFAVPLVLMIVLLRRVKESIGRMRFAALALSFILLFSLYMLPMEVAGISQAVSTYGLLGGSMVAYAGADAPDDEGPVLLPASTEPEETMPSGEPVTVEAQTIEPETTEPVYVWDQASILDFNALAEKTTNEDIKAVHQYMASLPEPQANAYTGRYEGYNVIYITAESFSHLAVREDITPTLYKLVHEGFYFENFYNPVWEVSTLDGEYVNVTGLLPKSGVWSLSRSSKNTLPLAMGNALRKLGYTTQAYHNHTYTYYDRHKSHPNLGYDYKGVGNGLKVKKTWPESDLEMMELTIPEYIDKTPFHTYYMSVSGHMLYTFTGNTMSLKNKAVVDGLDLSTEAKAYLASQVEFDRAMEYLLKALEAKGVADKTLIVIGADHYPYGMAKKTIDELSGQEVESNFELYRSSLVIYAPGMQGERVERPVSSLDILPTVYNLLGYKYDSRLLMGRDAFSTAAPLVIFNNRSFITDQGRYNALSDQWEGQPIEEEALERIKQDVKNRFWASRRILELNYYKSLTQ